MWGSQKRNRLRGEPFLPILFKYLGYALTPVSLATLRTTNICLTQNLSNVIEGRYLRQVWLRSKKMRYVPIGASPVT